MTDQFIRRRKATAKTLRRELVHKLVDQHLDEAARDRVTGTIRIDFLLNLGGVYDVNDARIRDGVLRSIVGNNEER